MGRSSSGRRATGGRTLAPCAAAARGGRTNVLQAPGTLLGKGGRGGRTWVLQRRTMYPLPSNRRALAKRYYTGLPPVAHPPATRPPPYLGFASARHFAL